MRTIWAWVAIILVSICIILLMVSARVERTAYQAAHGAAVLHTAQQTGAKMPPGHWLLIRRIPRP